MNKEQQILEYVEIHAIAQNIEMKVSGQKWTNVKVLYPNNIEDNSSKYYTEDFKTPNHPEEMKKCLDKTFKKLAQQILKDLNCPEKIEGLIRKEVVYKVCPKMLCGNNPCSCEEEDYD